VEPLFESRETEGKRLFLHPRLISGGEFYLFGVFLSKQLKCKLNIKFLNILCFGGEKLPFITFSFHFVQLYIN